MQLRTLLDRDALFILTHALISSHLDYCNVLYMRLTLNTTWKLQLDQNVVVQAVIDAPWFTHVTPLLRELHWLPVFFWMQFRMLVIVFKALNGTGADYLQDRLFLKTSTSPTRLDYIGQACSYSLPLLPAYGS